MDWYLSVTDHIVEFVPTKQNNNGINIEVILSPPNLYTCSHSKLDLVLAAYDVQFICTGHDYKTENRSSHERSCPTQA